MQLKLIAFLFLTLYFGSTLADGDGDGVGIGDVEISGSNDKCAEFCSKTYPAHTFDHSGAEQSCKQGCRLYSIIQFADKMKSNIGDPTDPNQVNNTLVFAACDRECGDAYSDDVFKRACLDGCQHQTPSASGQVRVVIDDKSPFFPFANKLINDAMGKFGDFKNEMKSHLDNLRKFFNTDSQEQPETAKEGSDDEGGAIDGLFKKIVGSLKMGQDPLSIDNTQRKPKLFGGLEDVQSHTNGSGEPLVAEEHPRHQFGSEFEGPSIGNEDESGEPIIIVKMIPIEMETDDDSSEGIVINEMPPPPRQGDVMYADADDGWLACLARRTQNLSMLSRWLLCLTLMLSILCMFWLCLAVMRTQRLRRRRLYTQYRAGKSDVIYFTPPPAYERVPASAAYKPLEKEEKIPQTPPPAYEAALESVKTEIPKNETV